METINVLCTLVFAQTCCTKIPICLNAYTIRNQSTIHVYLLTHYAKKKHTFQYLTLVRVHVNRFTLRLACAFVVCYYKLTMKCDTVLYYNVNICKVDVFVVVAVVAGAVFVYVLAHMKLSFGSQMSILIRVNYTFSIVRAI